MASKEHNLTAFGRKDEGKGASRRLRRAGRIPAVIYGGGADPVSIELEHEPTWLAQMNDWFYSSIITLTVDGKAQQVLLRDMQRHPYKQIIMHLDFQRVKAGEKIHVKVPLHFLNADVAPGVKTGGGKTHHIVNELDVQCFPGSLPEFIAVDMGKLEVGHSIHANDLVLPAGVELVAHIAAENPAVASINAPKGGAAEEAPAAPAA